MTDELFKLSWDRIVTLGLRSDLMMFIVMIIFVGLGAYAFTIQFG